MTIISFCKDSCSKKNSYFQKGINKSVRKIRPRQEKRCNHNNIVYFSIILIVLGGESERAKEKQIQLLASKTYRKLITASVTFFFFCYNSEIFPAVLKIRIEQHKGTEHQLV